MRMTAISVASCYMLAACIGGSGSSSSNSGSGQIAPIPAQEQRFNKEDRAFVDTLTGDEGDKPPRPRARDELRSISYNPATDTLNVGGDPFDLAGTFRRSPGRDVRGFAAFENDGGARRYLALVRTDTANGVSAGVIGTPYRFDNEIGGTFIARSATPDLPRNMEVNHIGDYAAVRNVGRNDGADMSNSFLQRVEGKVQLDLDFFDDRDAPGIEGVITDRRNLDQRIEIDGRKRPVRYDDVVLRFTDIDEQGNFSGIVNINGNPVGVYDGFIAGIDAAASAGTVIFVEGDELERGAFIAGSE